MSKIYAVNFSPSLSERDLCPYTRVTVHWWEWSNKTLGDNWTFTLRKLQTSLCNPFSPIAKIHKSRNQGADSLNQGIDSLTIIPSDPLAKFSLTLGTADQEFQREEWFHQQIQK
jgi:hypothetical protein